MTDEQLMKQFRSMRFQLADQQSLIANLEKAVKNISGVTNQKPQVVIVGVKDITAAQLYDAYKKGLNMRQLIQLADGKYTAEQIYKKSETWEVNNG
jgi:hypothetical protein